jgi:acetamidase/formamidase
VPPIHISREQRHLAWDNTPDPAVVAAPGDESTLDLADASAGQIGCHDDASAIARLDFSAVNPCTGPVFVEGIDAGDDLVVEILDIATEEWAWRANIPGFGLVLCRGAILALSRPGD